MLVSLLYGRIELLSGGNPDVFCRIEDTVKVAAGDRGSGIDAVLRAIPDTVKPVWGYRFVITGDFNGDGRQEQLTERFLSGKDYRETNKFYEGLSDYDQLLALTVFKEPVVLLSSSDPGVDTLFIAQKGQVLGLSYLKNEGDLNGDGTDELSYVVNWADRSNLNTWHIVTYRKGRWEKLYSFPIWDWQLPDLPQTYNQYGIFGTENKVLLEADTAVDLEMEKQLLAFEGLVKYIRKNRIRVVYRNEEAMEDTMTVDLSRLKAVKK